MGTSSAQARSLSFDTDRFVTLVQVADPSALVNVLDDEVVAFLRQFMRNG